MSREDPGIQAVMRKRQQALSTRSPGDVTAAETTPEWRPKNKREAELHRERGRRVAAERRARAMDSALVSQVALEYFNENGVGDPVQVFADLQNVLHEGGPEALDTVVSGMTEMFGDALDSLYEHIDEVRHEQAREQAFAEAKQRVEHRQALADTDKRALDEHADLLADPRVNGATLDVLQGLAEHGMVPDESDTLDERDGYYRDVVTLGKDLADHRLVQAKKASIMQHARGSLNGEDPSLPRSEARAASLWKLGYLNDEGEFDPDSSWDPEPVTRHVRPSSDELADEEASIKARIRAAADYPQGFPNEHEHAAAPPQREDEWGQSY